MIAINAERLWSTLNEMARIGATPAGGVTRLTLSDEDRQARDLLRQWAQEAGFPAQSIAWAICLSAAPEKIRSWLRY